MKQLIIGIGHKKHTGKSTLADMINWELEFPSHVIAFADGLKEEVASRFYMDVEELELHKDFFRPALQFWGTQFRRIYQKNDNYWVDLLEDKIYNGDDLVVIIPDVRFPNEAEWVKSKGGKLIKLSRPKAISVDYHLSELALNNYQGWDMEVLNDGSKEELLQKARGIISSLIMPNLPTEQENS